jgi:hypothetical protein
MKLTTALVTVALAFVASSAHATTYTNLTINELTAGITNYATFSNYTAGDAATLPPPFTPSSTELINDGWRVYSGETVTGISGGDLILATFNNPVSSIRVFSSIDHTGSPFDGYQYSIFGSNGNGWTSLFDAISVTGAAEPFTLNTYTGTAPTTVNNVVTGACGPQGGCVGYQADFSFTNAYQQYAFGPSTVAIAQGNSDQELSAVAQIPEPETYAMLLVGLGLIGFTARRKKDIEV